MLDRHVATDFKLAIEMPKLFNNAKITTFNLLLSLAMLFSLGYAPILTSVGLLEMTESVEFEEMSLESTEATVTRRLPENRHVSARLPANTDVSLLRLRRKFAERKDISGEHTKRNGIGSPLRV